MAMGIGRRVRNIALLAGTVGALAQMMPDQSMREQVCDLAAAIEAEADTLAEQFEFSDELPTNSGIKAA